MKKHNILKDVLWIIVTVLMIVSWFLPDADWSYITRLILWLAELVFVIMALREKNSVINVILVTIMAFMLFTWVLPAAVYSGQFADQGRIQMGFFDLFNYPVTALSYFGYIAFFILAIGGFYGILNKIPAYRTFLNKFVAKVQGTEKMVLVIMMLLIAVLTSLGGMQLALLVFFPMLVSIILLMGFDKMVAAMVLVGSVMVGIAGSTYGYGNTNIIMSALSLGITSEIITKIVILLLGLIILVVNVIFYINKKQLAAVVIKKEEVKKPEVKVSAKEETKKTKAAKTIKTTKDSKNSTKTKSGSKKSGKSSSNKNIKAALKDEDVIVVKETVNGTELNEYVPAEVNGSHSIWPFIVVFSLLFVLFVLAFLPWSNGFGNEVFSTVTTGVTKAEMFGFPIWSKLLGTINAFGYWTVIDLLFPLTLLVLFLSLVYKVKFNDVLDGFLAGIKKALPLGLIVVLVYTCLVIVTYHPFQLTIYKVLLGAAKKFGFVGALVSSFVATLASAFNVDPSYAFQSVLMYLTSVVTDTASYPVIGVIFQSMYGFTMLFAPTSVILMVALSYLDIPYKKWLKTIWKLLLEFLVILLIVFTILVLL